MAKTGLVLRNASGKVAGMTVYTRNGNTIIRDGNNQTGSPVRTQAQVNARARFKLLSQLSQVFSSTIAIHRDGSRTARNQFSSVNAQFVSASDGVAVATLGSIQLTKSVIALPGIQIGQRSAGSETFDVMLDGMARQLNGVVYNVYSKTADGSLLFQASTVVTEPNDGFLWDGKLPYVDGEILVLAYGFSYRHGGMAALARYGSMQVLTGEDVARLVATSQINTKDVQFTMTRGAMQDAEGRAIDASTATKVRVAVAASPAAGGTVTGAGSYDRGSTVTVTATPNEGYSFTAWRRNGSSENLSTSASYQISNLQNTQDLVAVFTATGGGGTLNPD